MFKMCLFACLLSHERVPLDGRVTAKIKMLLIWANVGTYWSDFPSAFGRTDWAEEAI